MLKSIFALAGAAVLVAAVAICAGIGIPESHHMYLLADGGQPPPGPLPICWPWDYPCPPPPPQLPQGGPGLLLQSQVPMPPAAFADRPRRFIFRAA
jgi:hypothetical protein